MNVCAFTAVCEEDARWLPQYLAEAERLRMHFFVHFDRCQPSTKLPVCVHPLCRGWSQNDDPDSVFDETHKQAVLSLAEKDSWGWAMAWDVDETFEKHARAKILDVAEYADVDHVRVRWVNLWGDVNHCRVDGPFEVGRRVKFYRLNAGVRWVFRDPKVNGPKPIYLDGRTASADDRELRLRDSDLACLHHGMMTREDCLLHKERWDRIYGRHGGNPYRTWEYAADTARFPPVVVRHGYF
jgi:hypothetical protein